MSRRAPSAPRCFRPGRRWASAVLAVVGVVATPRVAAADAAEPTDYESVVVAIEPPTDVIDVATVGGDSFLQLRVEPGTEATVLGYQGEPFLRFLPDGTVEQNERSPSVYLSLDRTGTGEVPAHADASLPPSWRPIGEGGRYAWHDHRAHWMSPDPPPNHAPGERIQQGVIPIVVAGVPVQVTIAIDWLPKPSRVSLYVGAAVAAVAVAGALAGRRRVAGALAAVAIAAAGMGAWQYRSLPPETGPRLVWWLLPAIAAVSMLAAVALGRRLLSSALVILAGLELAAWVYVRRNGAVKALLPTDAPFWLDRGVLGAAAVAAVTGVIGGTLGLYRSRPD